MKAEAKHQKWIDLALAQGANAAAVIRVADIPFRREFRAACEANSCGGYGANWMCPPHVGDIDEMIERAKGYHYALVFQRIGQLEDSYDVEGMQEAAKAQSDLLHALADLLEQPLSHPLRLGVGGCQLCERCTCRDQRPCRHPDKAAASLEAYGVAVSELAALCGMNYINGQDTVTYFGAFLYYEGSDRSL